MSAESVKPHARELCAELRAVISLRTVIVGVGNRDRGDDGFGPAVIDALRAAVDNPLIDAGVAPENYVHVIAGEQPDAVLFVDAGDFDAQPGDLRLLPVSELVGGTTTTHTGGLQLVAQYVATVAGARAWVLMAQIQRRTKDGVMPGETELSPDVRAAVFKVARLILRVVEGGNTCMTPD